VFNTSDFPSFQPFAAGLVDNGFMKWFGLSLFLFLAGGVLTWANWLDRAANRDWKTVEKLVGYPGQAEGDGFKIKVPRLDLNVLVHGAPVDPRAGLTSWFAFKPLPHGNLMMGEMVLVDWEVPRIESLLQSDELTLTSVYRPFNGETPGVVLVGFTGKGSRMLLAREAGALLAATSMPVLTPLAQTPNSTAQTAFGLLLEKILGPAQWTGEALSFSFVSPKAVTNEGTEIPAYMGLETDFHFQSDGKKAKVYGQWVLSQKEAPGVIESLMKNHIGIMDTHSALLDLSPPQVFINFWAEGDSIKIAKVLKEALRKTQLAGWTPNAPEAQQP
jgi:hypothetical protein